MIHGISFGFTCAAQQFVLCLFTKFQVQNKATNDIFSKNGAHFRKKLPENGPDNYCWNIFEIANAKQKLRSENLFIPVNVSQFISRIENSLWPRGVLEAWQIMWQPGPNRHFTTKPLVTVAASKCL